MIPDDASLVHALQQGSQEAFSEIYRRYSRMVFIQAFKKVGVREVAEDILQEVFSALWTGKATLQPDKSLKAYLLGIVRFKVIDYYRLTALRLRHLDSLTHLMDQPEAPLQDALYAKEQEKTLHTHIQSLSDSVRTIFLLSRYDGLSIDDISQKLQLSNQTVRNQISKALKTLRLKWEE
ncbi:RNA polymerase sigma-70 factor (ECF subfamily) [Dinghuibacter silviterrae]|uniref:RNA polymerase sigma-70 factor (ECF subfamily) n=2 Tax=Dinghuibacter silviterrae TaxID=1539049 RepID=A0A4R8DQ01_9BACT|nr:RNA polymerase sigma-70 factor (ECF subfamily) [Dinghuibacter silviterrae]